jgi:hypothetical protein
MAQGVSELVGGGEKNLRKIELKSSSLKDKGSPTLQIALSEL